MILKKIFLLPFLFISLTSSEKLRFDNYTLYKILPENNAHIEKLQDLHNELKYDFWSDPVPSKDYVSVMSSPQNKGELEEFLKKNDLKYVIAIEDLQRAIERETIKTYTRSNIRSMEFDAYYSQENIDGWLNDLVKEYPQIASIIIGGRSHEGRDIRGIKISHGSGKRIIFIESGIHAREWIAPATACYIINELLTSNDTETRAAARDYDWYIYPVTNPDGYIYSHEQNRMWRKNRRPVGTEFGTDLNRNWNHHWLEHRSSTDPATEQYAGPGPFSEPESRSLSTYLRSISDRIDLYLSFHSFGQILLLPFGNSTTRYANYDDAISIGRRAMGALSVRYGTRYTSGNIAEAIYQATGGSVDWVKEQLRIPLVYVYEFRDLGEHGFLLPPDQIRPNSEEVMDSVLEMIHQAKRLGYMSSGYAKGLRATLSVTLMALIATILMGK